LDEQADARVGHLNGGVVEHGKARQARTGLHAYQRALAIGVATALLAAFERVLAIGAKRQLARSTSPTRASISRASCGISGITPRDHAARSRRRRAIDANPRLETISEGMLLACRTHDRLAMLGSEFSMSVQEVQFSSAHGEWASPRSATARDQVAGEITPVPLSVPKWRITPAPPPPPPPLYSALPPVPSSVEPCAPAPPSPP